MSGFVVDASLVVATLVVEADTVVARRVLGEVQLEGAAAPPHLTFEVANALTMKMRRGIIDAAYRDAAMDAFLAYEIAIDGYEDREAVARWFIKMADRFALTIYDAAYLELAHRESRVLATLDGFLGKAARRAGVAVAPA